MRIGVIPVLIVYLSSFVGANLLVKYFGPYGLWFSSFFLIPFDFVARCYFQEKYKGAKFYILLSCLIIGAGMLTLILNHSTGGIAIGSVFGFASATLAATFVYSLNKKKSWFLKVNGSDLAAICCDSLVFQLIAFGGINLLVTGGQIIIKFAGGLMWYYILFKKLRIQNEINP